MTICRSELEAGLDARTDRIPGWLLLMAIVMAAVLAAPARHAGAAAGALSKEDHQCLGCHSMKGLERKLSSGETISLHVDPATFGQSSHGMLGCSVCHSDMTSQNHPPAKTKFSSARDASLARVNVCRACHANIFEQYEGGIHAALRAGNPAAPLCTTCHSPHATTAKTSFDLATGAPCSICHYPVFEAYADSVHGEARRKGRLEAPACTNCHGAHDVRAASGQDRLKNTCFGCHAGARAAHQKWLPNAERHLQTISCSACHTPGAKRKVDLRLYDRSGGERIAEKEGIPEFEALARGLDATGKGLDSSEVQRLLQKFSNDGGRGDVILRGRLEVDNGVQIHQLAAKSKASAQCEECHRSGSAPFEKVTISVADAAGRPLRYDAEKEVLTSVVSVDAVRGFYVIGGTRILLLDIIIAIALLAGIAGPIAHLTLSWLFRRYAKRIGGREDS
jgi:nitrate/TMAO reductase-like tetraheme cytochrome c subunit